MGYPTSPRIPAMELTRMTDPAPRAMRCGAVTLQVRLVDCISRRASQMALTGQ